MKNLLPLLLATLLLLVAGGAAWVLVEGFDTGGGTTTRPGVPRVVEPDVAPAPPRQASVSAPGPGVVDRCLLRNDEGILALEAGHLERAVEHFLACTEDCPEEPAYRKNLAEACARLALELHGSERADDRGRAVALLEQAVQLEPGREALARMLGRWRRTAEAEESFERRLTVHFELSFDLDRAEIRSEIDDLCLLLEDAYHEFGDAFGKYPIESGRARIRVVLYTRAEFDAVTGLGDWAGGVFDGTIRVPVANLANELPRVARVLRHELLHAFVETVGGGEVPGWMNEGLAQFLEVKSGSIRGSELERARDRLAGTTLFPLTELEGSLASWTDTDAIERAYAQALALVGAIEAQYGDRVLYEMVAGCAKGRTPAQSFRNRIGLDLTVLLGDLQTAIDR